MKRRPALTVSQWMPAYASLSEIKLSSSKDIHRVIRSIRDRRLGPNAQKERTAQRRRRVLLGGLHQTYRLKQVA